MLECARGRGRDEKAGGQNQGRDRTTLAIRGEQNFALRPRVLAPTRAYTNRAERRDTDGAKQDKVELQHSICA